MKELKAKPVAEAILEEVRAQMDGVCGMLGRAPRLALLCCGEDPRSKCFEERVLSMAKACGIEAAAWDFPAEVGDAVFRRTFDELNCERTVDGIVLLRPLPGQLNESFVTSCIDAEKDVDGASPINAAGIYFGTGESFAPCMAQAVIELLRFYGISLSGRHVVIIGASPLIGRPLSMLLLEERAVVTICGDTDEALQKHCKKADILIPTVGRPRFVTGDLIRKNTVLIDAGLGVDAGGRLCGDIDFASCMQKARAIAPLADGVCGTAAAVLMRQVMQAAGRALL